MSTQNSTGTYADLNRLRMYYEVHGDGPPLLLLHGGTGTIPRQWIGALAAAYKVVAMEQMGHGRTADCPSRAFHYRSMAEDTIDLMQYLEIESAMLVGYSDGGIIGLHLAIHHPERITKLAVTGANFSCDGYRLEFLEKVLAASAETWPATEEYRQLSPDGADHWPVVWTRLKQMWLAEPDFTHEQLQSIRAPTLVIAGDRDIVRPEHTVEMFNAIPGAQLNIVPNSFHGVMPMETLLNFLAADSPQNTVVD